MEVAKRVLQLRWLIIDEISMVSAKLLATIDMKLRSVVRVLGTQKKAENSVERSFGGLNVLMCGDSWQLPSPDGVISVTFLQNSSATRESTSQVLR